MVLNAWTFGGLAGAIFLFIIGLVLIIKGGDYFVDAAVWVADVLKIPKFLIGATIVSLATTLPELLVSSFAVAAGKLDTGIGNAVGSVTANTGLILALSAIFVSGTVNKKEFGIKSIIILTTILILFVTTFTTHMFTLIPSFILFGILGFYIYITIKLAKEGNDEKFEDVEVNKKAIIINIIKFIGGAVGIVIGAQLLVDNSTVIALSLGVSEGIIAITIVAIGTSLPELVTTITSIVKKQGSLGVGNIIGANTIDLVLILPICSFISKGKLDVSPQAYILDIPACAIILCIAIIPTLIKGKFSKVQGFAMLGSYLTYVALAAIYFGA